MIFVSTGGIHSKSAAATAHDLYQHGIRAVELSGGVHSATQEVDLHALPKDLVLQVHNYFPPPPQPFVFNLASSDQELATRSIEHVRNAMRLAVGLNRPVYSFHAGFRINPSVSELGAAISRRPLCNRGVAFNRFCENVLLLAEEARCEGVTLLVENNVLSAANMATFGDDPLLLTHPDEMKAFMGTMPSNVGLLLDVAHLKVSARTLGFDPVAAHALVKPWIQAYHLSDNNGLADSNNAVTSDSWFWDVIKKDLDYYSLEVYRVSSAELASQYEFVGGKLAKKCFACKAE